MVNKRVLKVTAFNVGSFCWCFRGKLGAKSPSSIFGPLRPYIGDAMAPSLMTCQRLKHPRFDLFRWQRGVSRTFVVPESPLVASTPKRNRLEDVRALQAGLLPHREALRKRHHVDAHDLGQLSKGLRMP